MDKKTPRLAIVRITEDLGKRTYSSEDVFSGKVITVILPSNFRMHPTFSLSIDSEVYVTISTIDDQKGRYIYSWRDPFRLDNKETALERQKKVIDARYKEEFGPNKFV